MGEKGGRGRGGGSGGGGAESQRSSSKISSLLLKGDDAVDHVTLDDVR